MVIIKPKIPYAVGTRPGLQRRLVQVTARQAQARNEGLDLGCALRFMGWGEAPWPGRIRDEAAAGWIMLHTHDCAPDQADGHA